ncbi:MAG: hypothetical protein MSC31_12455 [Solirubrobacteraceae bacterium MAG38_C4-C5]|nr:hypothetical protein [Candidatus Siliceabacter maunaloa]
MYGARRTPTRGFGEPFPIDAAERAKVTTDVEFDDQRNAIIAYQIRVPGENSLQSSRTVRANGARTDARSVATSGIPRFAVTAPGTYLRRPALAWLTGDGDGPIVGFARASDGLFGEAVFERLPDDDDVLNVNGLRFAVTGDDALLAAYDQGGVVVDELGPEGSFDPAQRLTTRSVSDQRVAVGRDGRVALAWSQFVDESGGRAAFAVVRPPGGQFSAPVQVSAPGENPVDLDVVVTSEGVVRVAYLAAQPELSTGPLRLVTLGGPTETLTAAGTDAIDVQLAADGRGGTTVAWQRGNPGDDFVRNAIFARAITPSGRVGKRRQLTRPGEKGEDLTLAVGADGSALVAWTTGEDLFGDRFRAVRRSSTGG